MAIRIGVAGWSIGSALADCFPGDGTNLARYARRFNAAEINSSFYRPHRRATYERWAASVPPDFRFAVKLPKSITHERRLADCADLLDRFADETGGLGEKRGPVLVQLPPSLIFDAAVAEAFFETFALALDASMVIEPRHATWFEPDVDRLLAEHRISRVAADPAKLPAAAQPGGWTGLAYFRLHGAPRVYWSPYDEAAIAAQAEGIGAIEGRGLDSWTIYDNTASGAAIPNALALSERLDMNRAPRNANSLDPNITERS
ncbi:MAG: hypothetical protein JWN66_318 [Sphingomonas bacterium]|uniref:DUF72 domain-containing protein n=1 Tax=Sphingomonas bacterium TaxID=1895847 RepID=UPI0026090925|nr:DUF72 domain-containing protein [Sphingomonas bacterium]MDB5703202.1 hypothetical protein [Sphingomonas bacterium]